MKIEEIENSIERFVAFIAEREVIRIQREHREPWPWTEDTILQEYRFTNVHREDDAVSKHYQKMVRDKYFNDPIVLPATIAYRWFNRPSTCDALFGKSSISNRSIFELYLNSHDIGVLLACIRNLPPPHVTGAFIITGKPGHTKAEGVVHYIHEWCQRNWTEQWYEWKKNPPLLSDMYEWINSEGLGSFMRGQIIADLKYLSFMKDVGDWWIWATPGPGSLRGLNIVLDRPLGNPWPKYEWLIELMKLSDHIAPELEKHGIGRLHNQDLQNCLCEFSKWTKTARGIGRPRQIFKHRG